MENTSKEFIDSLFKKYEELLEYNPGPIPEDIEKYIPIDRNAGPKPLTIEEYKRRQESYKRKNETVVAEVKKKKKRGGKKVQKRKEIAKLYRELHLEGNKEKKIEIKKKIIEKRKQ